MGKILETSDLRFAYRDRKPFHFPDINLPERESLLVIGNSGIGKTTFLHLLAGILKPDAGTVRIAGTDLTKLRTRDRDKCRGQHIGLIYQTSHFIQSLTLKENLQMVQYLSGAKEKKDIDRVLERLGISDNKNQYPRYLSQGQQQRASIAIAVINAPKLLLADEPTSSLDDGNTREVIGLLKEQVDEVGSSLVIITHDGRLRSRFSNTLEL